MNTIRFITLMSFAMGCLVGGLPKTLQASLDNNSETILDPTLETLQDVEEEEKFKEVAKVISDFVARQSHLRQTSTDANPKDRQLIQGDLPQTAPNGAQLILRDKQKYATRDVHRKTHGCYSAQLQISESIQDDLNRTIDRFIRDRKNETAQEAGAMPEVISDVSQLGVFQPGATYDAIVRYSNGHPGNRFDGEPDARGMALKILPQNTLVKNVDEMEVGTLNQATLLDILTINFPTFFVNDPVKYMKINEWFLKGSEDYRGKVTALLNQTAAVTPKFVTGITDLEQTLAMLSNGGIIYSPLFQEYFSMVPSRLGSHGEARAVKYKFMPIACDGDNEYTDDENKNWPSWSDRRDFATIANTVKMAKKNTPPFKEKYSHYYLREHAKEYLTQKPMCFALMFQLYRDQKSTNIEDSTDIWLSSNNERADLIKMVGAEKEYKKSIKAKKISPYIQIATLKLNKIEADYPAKNTKTCEDLSFNPWHGNIEKHKPLGLVSRMKRRVYNASRHMRHDINSVPSKEWERK